MAELQSKLFDLLFIIVPGIFFITLFFILEKKRKK